MGELRRAKVRAGVRNAVPLVLADVLLTTAAWVGAVLLRYDGDVPLAAWEKLPGFLPFVVLLTVGGYAATGLYSGVLRFASVPEARQILCVQLVVLVLVLPVVWVGPREVPLSVPIIATVLGCGMAGAVRFWTRLLRWRVLAGPDHEGERLLVIGAGGGRRRPGARRQAAPRRRGGRVSRRRRATAPPSCPGRQGARQHRGDRRSRGARDRHPCGASRSPTPTPGSCDGWSNQCGDLGIGLSIVPPSSELLGPPGVPAGRARHRDRRSARTPPGRERPRRGPRPGSRSSGAHHRRRGLDRVRARATGRRPSDPPL